MFCFIAIVLLLAAISGTTPAHAAERDRHPPAQTHPPARRHHHAPQAETPPPHAAAAAAPHRHGRVTGLTLPRFASLRSDKVNMRVGPGLRYPIRWVYQRRGLPVEIEREFDVWRYVRDADGIEGWMHQATLQNRRGFIVTGHRCTLRQGPDPQAPAVAKLDPGVVGRLRRCAAGSRLCQVTVGRYSGWLDRTAFWGTLPNEAVGG